MTQARHGKNSPGREGGTGDSRSTHDRVESSFSSVGVSHLCSIDGFVKMVSDDVTVY